MTVLEQLRTLDFDATQSTIGDDFGNAIDSFSGHEREDREKAAVFMEGIAEMRREWEPTPRSRKGARARSHHGSERQPP